MKRISSVLTVIMMLMGLFVFSVAAEHFAYEEINMDIPDDVASAPDDICEFYNSTKLWMTPGAGFIMYLDVAANEGNYVCSGYSQRDFEKFFEGYVDATDFEQYATFQNAENIRAGSMDGIRVDMYYDDGEEAYSHTMCGFATKEKTYTFYFDVSDEHYIGYVDSIIDSLSIEGVAFKGNREINSSAIIRFIVFAVVAPIIGFIKKKSDKKKASEIQSQQSEYYQNVIDDSEDEPISEVGFYPQSDTNETETHANSFADKEAESEIE